ncbi:MAG: maleylpyruvate isomerase family mycothiol-dependent enzyme [Actinomycetota bacterium]|nr:maleylpyruvate isomerase family mycothiol-dependent enzyme [Actinomycetota bacterium]MDP2289013.1 maleylpyruvate isomerase family mycothiol-dependent enzyme [Actinomycetota bacterium]
MLTMSQYQSAIEQYSGQFLEVVQSSDLNSPVPSCPGWTMADLTQHLSGTQRWSTEIVRTGTRAELPVGPLDRAGLELWFSDGARGLVQTLREIDPQQPTWNFGPEPRVASFWSRRQAHEAAVHLWDAMNAQGRPFEIEPKLAADGIDEVCTVFLYMKLRHASLPDWAPALTFIPTDVADCAVQLKASHRELADAPHVTLRGSAHDLLLALWGRRDLQGIQIEGDAALASALLASGITP